MEEKRKKATLIVLEYMSAERTEIFLDDFANKIKEVAEISYVVVDNSVNCKNSNIIKDCITEECEINTLYSRKSYRGKWKDSNIEIVFCISDINGGYAKGNNIGVRIANDIFTPEYVIIANNDTVCLDDEFDIKLIDEIFSKDERIGCIGPEIVGLHGEYQSPSRYVSIEDRWMRMMLLYPFGHIFGVTASDIIANPKSGFVYRVMGSFMIFKTCIFLEVDGFDERTFLFAEECIIAEKLRKIGYSTYYADNIHILHNHGETINTNYKEFERMKIKFKSEMIYYKDYIQEPIYKIWIVKLIFAFFAVKFGIFNRFKKRRIVNESKI